jgi:hypothetical protein
MFTQTAQGTMLASCRSDPYCLREEGRLMSAREDALGRGDDRVGSHAVVATNHTCSGKSLSCG